MGRQYAELNDAFVSFIQDQHVFFVATAPAQGRVNLSPKGMDTLRVFDRKRIVWLNLTGSGNETAAHLADSSRITLMFCAFEGKPLILRVYGRARAIHPRDAQWSALAQHFPAIPGARQLIDVEVELVQTSCGMGVPLLAFVAERDALRQWAAEKGEAGLREYWANKNSISLDGRPTGIAES